MACLLDKGQPTELAEILNQDYQKQTCNSFNVNKDLIWIYYILFCLQYYPPQLLFIYKTYLFSKENAFYC